MRLDPGDWVVSHFIVPFQLSLQRSWGMGVHDARIAEFILELGGNELSSVALIARSGTSADSEAEELMQSQGIVISETQTGEMAGREAVRLDGHVEGRTFGVLLITGNGWEWGIDEGNGFRVWMFDQDEITVLAVVQADQSRLQEALRAGEQLLGTVSFLADE